MLAWRPGDLTRRYIEGERARFVSPIALFLFSIFAMFAVFSWVGLSAPTEINSPQQITELRKQLTEQRAEAEEARDARPVGDPKRAKYEKRIAEADEALQGLDAIPKGTTKVTTGHTGWATIDHGLEKWKKNPSLMLYKLQSSIYKFSWLLIPLSVPFVWLMFFWKREYRLYDHTVFVTYSIAFMSLLFIGIALAATAGLPTGMVLLASFGLPFFHLLRQMQQAYRLSWLSAFVRTAFLSFCITIIVTIFLTLLILLGLFG
jgi:hypothetical protein